MTRYATRLLCLSALGLSTMGLVACATAPSPAPTGVEVVWSADGFDAPESVLADERRGLYYVSNVNGEGSEADGNGYISTLGADGELLVRRWVEGTDALPLHAPKGLAKLGDTLFVTDIDHVVSIDIPSAMITARVPVEGAAFLNDAERYGDAVLVTDSRTGRIHRIEDGEVSLFRETSEEMAGLNGVFCCARNADGGDDLLVATMTAGELYALDGDTGALSLRGTGMENADGIVAVGDGHVVSSWSGALRYVGRDSLEPVMLLDTSGDEILQNDIAPPLPGTGVDVVSPNWRPGTVTAYKVR